MVFSKISFVFLEYAVSDLSSYDFNSISGTAPTCGSKEYNQEQCRKRGYKPLHYTSDYGDGAYCSFSGTKVLCVKE